MTSNFKLSVLSGVAAAAVTVMAAGTANATNGMLPHCVGTVKCGKGGAGSARAEAAVDAAINPALAARMDNTYQVNLGWFWADVEGRSNYGSQATETSGADNFPNGSLGVNYVIDDKTHFNISVVPGGGGASDWPTSRANRLMSYGATTDQSVEYEMLYLQPSVGYKYSKDTSFGAGAIFSRATMKTDSAIWNTAGNAYLANSNPDTKETFYGVGFQIGGVWDVTDSSSFALNLRSPVWHQDTGVYDNEVFTDPIDTPMQIQAGLSFDVDPSLTVSTDIKWINWSGVTTIGNEPNSGFPTNTRGFGWQDQFVLMLGADYVVNDALTVRAGINHGESPIGNADALANYLFPAVVETHFTAGGDYDMGNGMKLGVSGYYAPAKQVEYKGNDTNAANSYIKHGQHGFQISFSNDF